MVERCASLLQPYMHDNDRFSHDTGGIITVEHKLGSLELITLSNHQPGAGILSGSYHLP